MLIMKVSCQIGYQGGGGLFSITCTCETLYKGETCMSEKVIIRQKSDFSMEFLAVSEPAEEDMPPMPVTRIHELTPYGMLLASVGSCTAIVLHTYARNHGVALDEVEIELEYERYFKDDCRDCEKTGQFTEEVTESLRFVGDLSEEDTKKLLKAAHYCPIFKIVKDGVTVKSGLAGDG